MSYQDEPIPHAVNNDWGWWRSQHILQALFFRASPRFYAKSLGGSPRQAASSAIVCVRGCCLGDMVIVDTPLDAVSGELVMYRYEHTIKQLLVVDEVAYLACATGAVLAEGHEVLGPVVATSRRGWRRALLKKLDFSSGVVRSVAA